MLRTHEDGPGQRPRFYQRALIVGVATHHGPRLRGALSDAHRWAGVLAPLRPTVLENPSRDDLLRAFAAFIAGVDPDHGAGVFVFCGRAGQLDDRQVLGMAGDEYVAYEELVGQLDARFGSYRPEALLADGTDVRSPRCRFLAIVDASPGRGSARRGRTWRAFEPDDPAFKGLTRSSRASTETEVPASADEHPRLGGHMRHVTPPGGLPTAEREHAGWGWGGDLTFHALRNPAFHRLDIPLFAHEIFAGTNGVAMPYSIPELGTRMFSTWVGWTGTGVPAKAICTEAGWPDHVMTLQEAPGPVPQGVDQWPRYQNSPFTAPFTETWTPIPTANVIRSYLVKAVPRVGGGVGTEIGRMVVYTDPTTTPPEVRLQWWAKTGQIDNHGFYLPGDACWLQLAPEWPPTAPTYPGYQSTSKKLP